MEILIGEALKNLITEKTHPEKRYLFGQLMSYIKGENEKIAILFGLRRTGKSVLMFQAMEELGSDNCAYIYCQKNDETRFDCVSDVVKAALESGKKYIFVNEATRLVDFVGSCSALPDLVASKNRKVIVSGTESLGFVLAKKSGALLDRSNMIRTSYIPFREWNRLLKRDLDDYIKYGGTLSPEGTFYNNEVSIEYLDTAIVNNFLLPLKNLGYSNSPRKLYEALKNNELATYIQKMIDIGNEEFMLNNYTDPNGLDDFSYLGEDFSSSILGDFNDIVGKNVAKTGLSNRPLLEKKQEITEAFRKALRIHNKSDILESYLDKELLKELKNYMEELDMIAAKDENKQAYYFVQPGLRYSQCKMLIESLHDVVVDKEYSRADWEGILGIFKTVARGRLLEDIIFSDIARAEAKERSLDIRKYRRNCEGIDREFDVVVTDFSNRKSVAIEVKNFSKCDKGQTSHLNSEAFCALFEKEFGTKIVKKIVIYGGETKQKFGVNYINATEFLLRCTGRNLMENKEHI